MKNSLKEEQARILSLIREFHGTGYPRGESEYVPESIDNEQKLEEVLRNCINSGKSPDEIRQKVEEILDQIDADLPSEDSIIDPDDEFPTSNETMTGGIPPGIGSR